MTTGKSPIGRARTVLVFGSGEDEVAVISSVIARAYKDDRKERMRFVGPVKFSKEAASHFKEDVLPIVDRIFSFLGMPTSKFEISVANLSATSEVDIGLKISGFSADVSVLLAMVSAGLDMPIPEDVVSTGHISSSDGDIGLVKSIPTKLDAALGEGTIHNFIYPSIDTDGSLKTLSPMRKQNIEDAITRAKREIKSIGVKNIEDLLKAVFSDKAVVLASLRKGFFKKQSTQRLSSDKIGATVRFLVENNEGRFWSALEHYFLAGDNGKAQEILSERVRFHIQEKAYPEGIGHKLKGLVQSLPPATRRLKIEFPIISIGECIRLSQFAGGQDHEDVTELFNSVNGKELGKEAQTTADGEYETLSRELIGKDVVESVLSKIDSQVLLTNIGHSIDEARASFIMDSVTVESNEEFNDTIATFMLHMSRHYRGASATMDREASRSEAHDLLEKTFSAKGGSIAALAEGKNGTNGGMRFILDVMTEQFKKEEQEKYINMIFKEALDPMVWEEKLAFISAFLERIKHQLPPDIKMRSPEEYANHYELIVRMYAKSFDKVKELLRTL